MRASLEVLFGNLTLWFALGMTFVGFPIQIRKHYIEKKAAVSMTLILLAIAVYVSRFVYGILIKSPYIAIPDFFGIIFSIVIIYQILHYRKP